MTAMTKRKKIIIGVVVAAVVIIGIIGIANRNSNDATTETDEAVAVETGVVQMGTI